MNIPDSALAHHLSVIDDNAEELSNADPKDEEGIAAAEGAIEALLFAMKELYQR